eukprot:351277-Chlamydomonas_euryale.AAC.6
MALIARHAWQSTNEYKCAAHGSVVRLHMRLHSRSGAPHTPPPEDADATHLMHASCLMAHALVRTIR